MTALLMLAAASAGFLAGVIWAALGRISKQADEAADAEAHDHYEDVQ